MFSGKTSALTNDIIRFRIAKYNVAVFKPSIDTRFSDTSIVSHTKQRIEAKTINSIEEVISYYKTYQPDVIAIDEIQFLKVNVDSLLKAITYLLSKNCSLIMAGLDMDYEGKPFDNVKELLPISDYIVKHHAICTHCGSDAWVSHKMINNKDRITIGANDIYEPLCRSCYNKTIS